MEEMLKLISDFLKRNDGESEILWDVLTALRGPDDENENDKRATTEVIRYRLFGNAGRESSDGQRNLNGCLYGPDSESYVKIRERLPPSHFKGHAKKAFDALGLSWREVNE